MPLVYPVLLYLLARLLWTGFRPRERSGRLVPLVPLGALALGIVLLVGFRVGLNVADSNVIDVGYAGVIGADRIVDGDNLYGPGFSDDVERGDTYGPATYLAYVPFEQAMPWSGVWDDLPAAHGAALAFDLLTLAGLILLGRRLRPGPEGRELGVALGFAWAAYPYALFALQTNSNDSLVALFTVVAMLGAHRGPPARLGARRAARRSASARRPSSRRWRWRRCSPPRRADGALAPGGSLFAAAPGGRARRRPSLPFLPDGGLREIYDRTVGYQASRPSPFSVWGQDESLEWLQTAVQGRRRSCWRCRWRSCRAARRPCRWRRSAAAVLIAVQLGGDPLVLPLRRVVRAAGAGGAVRRRGAAEPAASRRPPRGPPSAGRSPHEGVALARARRPASCWSPSARPLAAPSETDLPSTPATRT